MIRRSNLRLNEKIIDPVGGTARRHKIGVPYYEKRPSSGFFTIGSRHQNQGKLRKDPNIPKFGNRLRFRLVSEELV
jgi:hypothetical protein